MFVFVLNGDVCTSKLPKRLGHVSWSRAEMRQMDAANNDHHGDPTEGCQAGSVCVCLCIMFACRGRERETVDAAVSYK